MDPAARIELRSGLKVLHRFNRDLGPGEVVAVEGDRVRVRFPRRGEILEFAVENHAFTPLVLPPGTDPDRWHEVFHEDMVERLARLEVDGALAWQNRLQSLRLARLREAQGLGAFLGGRIEIFPHQLHVARQAVATDPVRWLLADEVGLGKTVEACLILSRLLRTRRADRVLVVAPASLTVQWLGELYRKFHQVFVLLDRERRRDVTRDLGPDFNPFEVHPRSVIALEDLTADAALGRAAQAASIDLLVVDEAHRLERAEGHPGSLAYRAVAPLCASARHVLLLSATPLEADAHGFYRLLELLRPQEYPSWDDFRERLAEGRNLFPCTSATSRNDIGGLPPRVPRPVSLPLWPGLAQALSAARALPAPDALGRRRRSEAVWRALAHPTGEEDPRLKYLTGHEPGWHARGEKWLVFVNRRESLDILKQTLERTSLRRVAVFHEDLSPAARDLEVAQFVQPQGPTVMISTEAGGEGRNFAFCRGLVLFDLPWDPVMVEQRIGRLDRINRREPTEIVYFAPDAGFPAEITELYEVLGIFREPLGGLDRSLGHVEEAIVRAAVDDTPGIDRERVVAETRELRGRVHRALYHHLHQNRYRSELRAGLLARIPPDLETRTAEVVLEACRQFGFEVVAKPGRATWYVEFGPEAIIDDLPLAPGGSRWLGTFDREEAVARETLDFFASGHPLVEGIFLELEDGHRGQVALLAVETDGARGDGFLAVLRQGPEFELRVLDATGVPRPEWTPFFTHEGRPPRDLPPAALGLNDEESRIEWADRVRRLLYPLQDEGRLAGVAAFRLSPVLPTPSGPTGRARRGSPPPPRE